jgi:hypothetical protein
MKYNECTRRIVSGIPQLGRMAGRCRYIWFIYNSLVFPFSISIYIYTPYIYICRDTHSIITIRLLNQLFLQTEGKRDVLQARDSNIGCLFILLAFCSRIWNAKCQLLRAPFGLKYHEVPCNTVSWSIMKCHDISRSIIKYHEVSWNIWKYHEAQWNIMTNYEISWRTWTLTKYHEVSA